MARPKKGTSSGPPKTEIDLKLLQEEYLKPDCPTNIKDEFFLLLRTYARSLTLKEIKRKNIFLPPERVDEICTDATLLLLKQYEKEGWKIQTSFAGALYFKLLEAMYGSAKDEMNSSLNFTLSEDSNSKEVVDVIGAGSTLPWDTDPESLEVDNPEDVLSKIVNVSYSEVETVIEEAYEMLPYKTYMRFLPWLILQFRKPKTRNIKLLYDRMFLTSREEDAFDILFLEIRNRIADRVM